MKMHGSSRDGVNHKTLTKLMIPA